MHHSGVFKAATVAGILLTEVRSVNQASATLDPRASAAGKSQDSPHLRILSIFIRSNTDDKTWGSELSYLELANELVRQGSQVDTLEVSPSISRSRFSPSKHYLTSSHGSQPSRLVRQICDALRIMKDNSSDVIFVPADYDPRSLVVANIVSIISRKPFFLGVLDPFYADADLLPLSSLLSQTVTGKRSLRSFLFTVLRKISARRAAGCMVITQMMSEYCYTVLGARRTILNGRGVDSSWFQPIDTPKIFDAIFVGRLCKDKGVDTMLQAWKDVLLKQPDAKLAIIGSGDEATSLEQMADQLGIGNRVAFLGYLNDRARIQELVSSSRLFLFPSKNEGFARAVAEAMAAGLPAVISDIPNLRELYGGAAILVPVGDHKSFAAEVVKLLSDERRRNELSQSSRNRAGKFRWEKAAETTSVAFAASTRE